jgi:predicted SprT family Zn-dependent metalloprotease
MAIKSSLATEPYRFVCVECGSPTITKRQKGHDPVYTEKRNHHFYCGDCNAKNPVAYDKKQGIEVSIKNL